MIDLDELRKLAENAKLGSHGQWLHDQGHVLLPDEPGNDWDGEIVTQPARQVDAEFIAAANPQAVLALIERVRRVEAERDAALAAVEVTRKLHHKITRYGNDYYSISAESYEDDPSSYDDLEPFDLCAECYEVERLICEECGGDAPIGHRSSWPCPTVTALDVAPEPEGQWEYRGRLQSCGYVAEGYISAEYAMNGLRVELEDHPYLAMDDTAIVERARVREWLPVEGESKP